MVTFYENVNHYINNKKISYVSFDLYDTLIFRAVYRPEDVWALLHKRFAGSNRNNHLDIKRIRERGELAARRKTESEDVTIDDIYAEIDLDTEAKENLKKTECEIEAEVSMPNKPMIDMLNGLREKGIRILITTDMYLDEKTIKTILDKNQISFDRLYISGKAGFRKESGNLFKYILEDLGIAADNMVHIGDNKRSDVDNAKLNGIEAFHYLCKQPDFEHYLIKTQCGYLFEKVNIINKIKNKFHRCWKEMKRVPYDNISSVYFVNYLNAVCKSEESEDVRMGFCVLGPFIAALCHWIHRKKEEKKIDQLWFVAREGYLIKKVYLTLFPDDETSVRYVRYNKNVCRLPFVLSANSVDDILAMLPSSPVTIGDLLELFLVDNKEELLKKITQETGYTMESTVSVDEFGSRVFKCIWKNIVDSVRDKANEQRKLLVQSLKKEIGDVGRCPKIALVNNSINGSIQYMLEKVMTDEQEIASVFYGLQIIDSDLCRKRDIKYAAWLKDINNAFYFRLFQRTLNIFERLSFENCGTALYLTEKVGEVQPVYEDNGTERNNDAVLLPVQDRAIQFAEVAKRFKGFDFTEDALSIYFRVMSYPLVEDTELVGSLAFDEVNESGILINKCRNLGFRGFWGKARKEIWPCGFLVLNKAPKVLQSIFVLRDHVGFRRNLVFPKKRHSGQENLYGK